MAWSGNLRCLHCDGKLPLYRKLTSGQFCSKAHSDAYWQEQHRLAVERLHQTHDSLRAYKAPADTLEAILGKPAASEPVSSAHYYQADDAASVEPMEPELEFSDMARSAANTGKVTFAGFVLEDKPGLCAWEAIRAAWNGEFILWPMSRPALPQSAGEKQDYTLGAVSTVPMPRFVARGFATMILMDSDKSAPVEFTGAPVTKIRLGLMPEPAELSELLPQVVPEVEENRPPFADSLMTLQKFAAQAVSPKQATRALEPLENTGKAQNTRLDATFAIPAVVAVTRLEPLSLSNAPKVLAARAGAKGDTQPADLCGYAQPLKWKGESDAPSMKLAIPGAGPVMSLAPRRHDLIFAGVSATAKANIEILASATALELRSVTASPAAQLASPSIALSLNTAPGCRYSVAPQAGPVKLLANATEIEPVPAPRKQLSAQAIELGLQTAPPCTLTLASQAGVISAPQANVDALAAKTQLRIVPLPNGLGGAEQNPPMAKVLPLAFRPTAVAPPVATPAMAGVEQIYAANTPLNPVTRFEPVEGADKPQLHGFLAWTQSLTGAAERKHPWTHAADFWQHAPRDLKLLAVAIPILLALALRPSLPKVQSAAPQTTQGISKNIGDGLREQFINVRNSVAQRAGVSLSEDFRSGLEDWQARGDMSSGWSFDGNGFVKPGTLALYKPSMALSDYDMDFLGMVDKKALSWVVRAKDFDNYYVVKLMMLKGGPLPTLGITRYAVIDGKAETRVDTKVAIDTRPDMLYRVGMNVHDDTFLLSLQGSVIDNWTDARLKRGGVGFFAPQGEESRLRWLQLTHQYDMLGRLCAYLAPYNIPTTNGSW
ncbi:MAG: hypothetical protein M3O20_02540 [Acidobacteriota bacterium]|nr:hypothetical protein [Acidobacteriota bacterium]